MKESIVVCIDDSKWAINGDYSPTRYLAQIDAIKWYCNKKANENRETVFAFLLLTSQQVRGSFRASYEKVLQNLEFNKNKGEVNLFRSLKVAKLAQQNTAVSATQHLQRVLLFLCSPFEITEEEAAQIVQLYVDNSVTLDVVVFSDCDEANLELLNILTPYDHILKVVPGQELKAQLMDSSLMYGGDDGERKMTDQYHFDGEQNMMDDELDEDLQLALKMSIEDYQKTNNVELDVELEEEDVKKDPFDEIDMKMDMSKMTDEEVDELMDRLLKFNPDFMRVTPLYVKTMDGELTDEQLEKIKDYSSDLIGLVEKDEKYRFVCQLQMEQVDRHARKDVCDEETRLRLEAERALRKSRKKEGKEPHEEKTYHIASDMLESNEVGEDDLGRKSSSEGDKTE